ncbi:hypothetical protein M404DRAFT_851065 [Pisolithus tinctorius Marx 270]|uniref:Uncharacterized protein n=1 Tax=Pisolithus tinctorius Marx 270 TaxID=870435 RepID=A0A0C3INR4_PISTI|nr:hypothetical protein M404DRAFT_851065 [Pisolithus tinctorius Marx 270]
MAVYLYLGQRGSVGILRQPANDSLPVPCVPTPMSESGVQPRFRSDWSSRHSPDVGYVKQVRPPQSVLPGRRVNSLKQHYKGAQH